jgi:hypothetical protein
MGRGMNWNRPLFKVQGRQTLDVRSEREEMKKPKKPKKKRDR